MSLDLIAKEAVLNEILDCECAVEIQNELIGGIVCAKNGKEAAAELFPEAMWLDRDGMILQEINCYQKANGKIPEIIFVESKGAVLAAGNEKELKKLEKAVADKLKAFYAGKNLDTELFQGQKNDDFVYETAPGLRTLLSEDGKVLTVVSLSPFQIAKKALFADSARSRLECSEIPQDCKARLVSVKDKAVFCAAVDYPAALQLAQISQIEAVAEKLTEACGGPNYYGTRTSCGCGCKGRLFGKVAVVTGGAQGFGFGIARELAAEDAVVAIADMNLDGAGQAAQKLCDDFGPDRAFALEVNIASEESVAAMCRELVLKTGGLDLLVANAGVLRAGSVKDLSKKDWDFVTDINYTGYFLCAKYVARIMSAQNKNGNGWTDIVQVNSKSGLAGSNRNGAYAGSKFGTIGLTQSFALELVDDRIKVNSVCPGNFFDGPLWSDPDRGLFVQYLNSNKVPGAKTVEDVKRFYEAKIPMNRGCFPVDVAKAIMYAVEQQYETGQAIPVTGGQVMLN